MDLTLSLNHRCNLRCRYCYGGQKFRRPMTPSILRKALPLAFAAGSPLARVSFFGGEPLLEPDLVDFAAREAKTLAERHGVTVRFGMTTNGTLLSDARLDVVERHRVQVTVSLDGVREAHDCARVTADGRGTWEDVVAGLERARDRLGHVRALAVVHPDNVDLLGESFDFISSLGVRRMAFNLDFYSDWSEAAWERLEAGLEALADRALARYRAGEDFNVQPLHTKIVTRLKDGYASGDRCAFGCGEVAVAPSGRLYPCDRVIGEDGPEQADVCIGHVDSGIDMGRVMAMRAVKDEAAPDCEACALLDRCMWWCGCVNRAITGRIDVASDLLCRYEQLTIRVADRLAATLYAEENAPFLARYYVAAG